MKKQLLLFVMMLSMAASAFAVEEAEINGLWYELITKGNLAKVIQYKNDIKYKGTISIPETVEYKGTSYSVTSIGEYAFSNCNDLKAITIPVGIKSIEVGTFLNCSSLNSIVIPNSVTDIKGDSYYNGAFQGCGSLESVTIPSSLKSIGDYAFYDCNSLNSVHITDIGAWCNIVFGISSNPLIYAHHFFINGEEVKDLVIPNSVKDIGDSAFGGCTGLTSVTIPNSVKSIGGFAFGDCTGLTSITIPNSVTDIGAGAFMGCSSLTSVTIPNSVINLRSYAFGDCSSLTSITIPNSLTRIDQHMFYGCSSLASVSIPNSVKSIEVNAFRDCISLTSVTIPNSVEEIGRESFSGCNRLTTIVIGNGIKTIQEKAFANCSELTDVYCYAKNVPHMVKFDYPHYPCIDAFEGSYIEFALLHVPESSINEYQAAKPWSSFKDIVKIDMLKYTLTYMINEEVYKSYEIEEGAAITPEAAPTKEGYTFSGWSKIPEKMPAHDVTVTGTFSINKYKLTYTVDGEEYKTYEIEYGASITPEAAPTKEGYTFSGWSEIPKTMPAHDVTVTGTFTINKYKLTYTVDGEEYKTYELEYGATITPEAAPTKEGYTFSGWSEIPETMPAHDVTVTGTFTINKYKLTYIVNGAEYKTYEVEYGATITPEAEPTKEGYTFSGWSEIPETMPAHDVTVTGSFTKGAYKLTYYVDGVVYKTVSYDYGATITPEAEPTKEGYAFSGWSEIPETMPAHDVTVTGTFIINKYKLTYIVDDAEYKTYKVEYGATITPEEEPTKEGYTFSGWSEIPETMPAKAVNITGTFTINSYKLTYMIDDKVYKETMYEYGATIMPELQPEGDYQTFEWKDLPQTMPAHDVVVYASYTSGIFEVLMASQHNVRIYSPNGKKLNKLQKGLNIVIFDDGTVKKVMVK